MATTAETRSSLSQNPIRAPDLTEVHHEIHDYVFAAIRDGSRLPDVTDNVLPAKRRALIVAPLYKDHVETGTGIAWAMLKSTATDVMLMHKVLVQFGYEKANIRILSDVCGGFHGLADPTRENIFSSLEWLTCNTRAADYRFFHFTGHGERILREKDNGQAKQARRVVIDTSHKPPETMSFDTELERVNGTVPTRIVEQTILVEELAYYNEAIVTRNSELRPGDQGPASRIMDHELNFWLSKLPLESVLTCVLDCCASGRMLNASVKLLGAGFRGYRSKGKADPGIGLPPSPQPAPDEAYFRPQKEQAESGNQKPGPSQVPKHPISPVITRPMVPKPTMPVIIPKYISNKNIASEIATRPPQKSNDYITMLEEIPVRERNLDQIQAKTFVWTACHQRQEAWGHDDRQPYGSGIFTKVFTHAFETYLTRLTGNDGNNAYIDYNALFIHISQNVLKETEKLNTLQFVQLWTSLQGANEEKVKLLLQQAVVI